MKARNLKLFVCLMFLQVPFLHAEEALSGEDVASVVVGNTVQMEFRDAQDTFRTRTFHEYYDPDGSIYGMTKYREQQGNLTHYIGTWEVKDGRFCTSVYGRDYSCNQIKPLSGNAYELINEGGKIRER